MTDSQQQKQFNYLTKHIVEAVEILVTYPGELRNRLTYAGEQLLLIPENAVPENVKPLFMEIKTYLTKYKAEENGREPFAHNDILVTMKRRRNSSAIPIAKKIWELYHRCDI